MTQPGEQASSRRLPPVETRWKPGQSGNPAGRAKGSGSLQATLKRILAKDADEDGVSPATKDVVEALLAKAREGDPAAQKLLWDRIEGAVTKDVNLSGQVLVKRLVIEAAPKDLEAPDSP